MPLVGLCRPNLIVIYVTIDNNGVSTHELSHSRAVVGAVAGDGSRDGTGGDSHCFSPFVLLLPMLLVSFSGRARKVIFLSNPRGECRVEGAAITRC